MTATFACVLVFVIDAEATRATPSLASIEADVLAAINGVRTSDLVRHDGLASVARSHSRSMASDGSLSHDGSQKRVMKAPPDPPESNGAPDDGYRAPAYSCENVAFVPGDYPDPADAIFKSWKDSDGHDQCMKARAVNVGGVGVYFDGQAWWATFVTMTDHTPPSRAQPATPKPSPPAPAPTQPPPASTPRVKAAVNSLPAGPRPPSPAADTPPAVSPAVEATPAIDTRPISVEQPPPLDDARPLTALAAIAALLLATAALARWLLLLRPGR